MNIAVLHPQCRVRGGAIKMALLTAQSLKKEGHHVIFYTFEHDSECFSELQNGLTIVTGKTNKHTVDTVDRTHGFWGNLQNISPRFFASISIAWDIRQVDIVVAHNPPMQIVGALAKIFSFFSRYHQRLNVVWWHHHIPWYYQPRRPVNTFKDKLTRFFSLLAWKGFFERHYVLPRIKYLVATSYYTAFCLEKYCKRKAIVIHPVITQNPDGIQNTKGNVRSEEVISSDKGKLGSLTLFTHGRLEPGKGMDMLIKAWKELQAQPQNAGIKLIIAGDGSLKSWLIEQGATVISYQDSVLNDIKKTENDILAIYLSTIDAFGMAPLEAQIAGLSAIILDKGGARETVLLDKNGEPQAQLIDSEKEIVPAITYFIQHRTLQKRMSNVNFCHQREYFNLSRLDAEIRSLIDAIG